MENAIDLPAGCIGNDSIQVSVALFNLHPKHGIPFNICRHAFNHCESIMVFDLQAAQSRGIVRIADPRIDEGAIVLLQNLRYKSEAYIAFISDWAIQSSRFTYRVPGWRL